MESYVAVRISRFELSWNSVFNILKRACEQDFFCVYMYVTKRIEFQMFTMVIFQRKEELDCRGLRMNM